MTDTTVVEDVGTNALEPTEAPVIENVESTQVPETPVEANLDPEPSPEPEKVHGNKGKTPWYMERIHEETNKRRQIEEQLATERREKAEAKALLERLQSGDKEAPRAPAAEQDIDALVEARAAQKLFNDDCNSVAAAGGAEIPDFNEKLGVLRAIGVVNDDFLKDIFAVDKSNAHKILEKLASEPERASMMTRLDSRKRIAELTRISDRMTEAPKPTPAPVRSGVSKVPAPKPVVEAVSDGAGDMDLRNPKLDDATWSKLWNKKYGRKAG